MIADYSRLPGPQLPYHPVHRASVWAGNELKASQSKFMILHTVSILMGTKAEVNRMASKGITGQKRRLNQHERLILFFYFSHFMLCSCSPINDPISWCQKFITKQQRDCDGYFRSRDMNKGVNSYFLFLYRNDSKVTF